MQPVHILKSTEAFICLYNNELSEESIALRENLEAIIKPSEKFYGSVHAVRHELLNRIASIRSMIKLMEHGVDVKDHFPQLSDDDMAYLQGFDLEQAGQFTNLVIITIIDLFTVTPQELPEAIAEIRRIFPATVFILYTSKANYSDYLKQLPDTWHERVGHYFKVYYSDSTNFGHSLRYTLDEAIAIGNSARDKQSDNRGQVFISYSRINKGFVNDLVYRLKGSGFKVWIDNRELIAGNNWMDSLGDALDTSDILLLIMSAEALSSQYVRMEYQYFLSQGKPIIPIMVETIDNLPAELTTNQFVDFVDADYETAYAKLTQALTLHLKT